MILNDRAVDTTPARPATRHQIEWAASGLRRAAIDVGVALPIDYSQAVAADGLTRATQLGVTRLGAGVVLHTQPASDRELPIVIGYADPRGQWYRDGHRHTTPPNPDTTAAVSEELAL